MKVNKKSINKSIRLSPKVYNYITSHSGNGFNEQFENIIIESMEFETDRMKRIADLDKMIHEKYSEYDSLKTKIMELNKFLLVAVKANTMLKELDAMLKDIVSRK